MNEQRYRVRCETCGNGARGFFSSLEGAALERFERGKVVRRYARGEVVFREGEPASSIYCIQSGSVKLYKLGFEGEEVVIRLLGPGDIMGYRPLLANDAFAASARVLENTTICTVSRQLLMSTLRESPELAMHLMRKLATELRVSEDEMVRRAVETVPQRTARFLLWLNDAHPDSGDNIRFGSVLRREDMAMAIGTTPETLSRILHDLQRREIIGLSRREIIIRQPRELHRLAMQGALE
jgi:CRP-like cAMP-binding protein